MISWIEPCTSPVHTRRPVQATPSSSVSTAWDVIVNPRTGRSSRPRLFLLVANRRRSWVSSSGSGMQVWTDRATAAKALDPITSWSASVDPDLLWWMSPRIPIRHRSASDARGSRAVRTSRSRWVSRRPSMTDISGSRISSPASTRFACSSTSRKSRGSRIPRVISSPVITSIRNTRSRSASAAIRRGTMVCSQESSAAATRTERGRPWSSPSRVPRVTWAAMW